MSTVAWGLVFICTLFLIIWMSLSFTNQLCKGLKLCYKKECPVCPVCPSAPAPSPAPARAPGPAPAPAPTVSTYMPEPYVKE